MEIVEKPPALFFEHLGRPHHPPDDSISNDEFLEQEYDPLYHRLEMLLAGYGENDDYGQGDYCLGFAYTRSRGMGFQVTNEFMITHELLVKMQQILIDHAPEWEFSMGSDQYDWGIFVGPQKVWLWRDRIALLTHLLA